MSLMTRLGTAPPNTGAGKGLRERLAEAKEKRQYSGMSVPPFFYRMLEGCGVSQNHVDKLLGEYGMNTVTRFIQVFEGRRSLIDELPVDFESLLELYVTMSRENPEPDKVSLLLSTVLEHPELGELSPVKVYEKIRGPYTGLNARESFELARPSAPYEGNHRDRVDS